MAQEKLSHVRNMNNTITGVVVEGTSASVVLKRRLVLIDSISSKEHVLPKISPNHPKKEVD